MKYILFFTCFIAIHLTNSQVRKPYKGSYTILKELDYKNENNISHILGELFDGCNKSPLFVEGYAFTSLNNKAVYASTDSTNTFNLTLPSGLYVIKLHALGFTTVVTDTIFLRPNVILKINFNIGTWECP